MKGIQLQQIEIQCILISQHCWNASSKRKVKVNLYFWSKHVF